MVHDTFLTPLAQRADVVLPRVTFLEKSGTFTNLERRVQLLKPGLQRGDAAKSESWIFEQLAKRIGPSDFGENTPAETMEEIGRLAAIYSGISHDRLEKEGSLVLRTQLESPQPTQVLYAGRQHKGIQWPCPEAGHPGTPTLYLEGFGQRKAEPMTPSFSLPAPQTPSEYPLWFAPGRVLLQQDRTMELVKGKRNQIQREEWVEVNPADAAETGVAEGDKVAVETMGGLLPGVARFNDSLPRGLLGTTGLFGQLAIDMEASSDPDPAAMIQGLEVRPARLVKAE